MIQFVFVGIEVQWRRRVRISGKGGEDFVGPSYLVDFNEQVHEAADDDEEDDGFGRKCRSESCAAQRNLVGGRV